MSDKYTAEDLAEFAIAQPSSTDNKEVQQAKENITVTEVQECSRRPYEGDYRASQEEAQPLNSESGYTVCSIFKTPAHLVSVIKEPLRTGQETLHEWQKEQLVELAESFQWATAKKAYKLALCAANGSGKDYFVIAPLVIWAALSQKRCLVLITSSSGTQLTAQTENHIATLAREFNEYACSVGLCPTGQKVFHVRQRYIRCNLSGSEVRMFATDEAGRAEGYHPLEPGAKMLIIVNEAKTVSEEIFEALTRCTGFSHWLNVSTPGEPKGSFYDSFLNWQCTRHVTTYDCPHLPEEQREEDRRKYGEHSPLYRSKHLALFTSYGGTCIIPLESVNGLLLEPPELSSSLPERIGIDLAAGGDENCMTRVKGLRLLEEFYFHETDTTRTADTLERKLIEWGISRDCEQLSADDGGVGHAIIDMLVRRGWKIRRVLNQSPAWDKKKFGNRGAELWFLVKRIFEEHLFDPSGLSAKTRTQLTTRQYKKTAVSDRIFLESKKEAKAHGRPSPDRADAFVLTFNGFSLDDVMNSVRSVTETASTGAPARIKTILRNEEEIAEYYDREVTFAGFNKPRVNTGRRIYNSLARAIDSLKD